VIAVLRGPRGPLRHLVPYSADPQARLDEEIADARFMLSMSEHREARAAERDAKAKAKAKADRAAARAQRSAVAK